MKKWVLFLCLLAMLPGCKRGQIQEEKPLVRIGAKAFPESQILGEILRLLALNAGADVEDVQSLGDTAKIWNALLLGQIDAYSEYTGTLTQQIFADQDVDTPAKLRRALAQHGVRMSRSLGFANSYGLGMTRKHAEALHIRTISDLQKHPNLKLGMSAPFLGRPDGWRTLRKFYDLPQDTRDGMEHGLAYRSLSAGTIDVTDVYTTDAAIRQLDLVVLTDDRRFFPSYEAVILYRADLDRRAPQVVDALLGLEGTISEDAMIDLNVRIAAEPNFERRIAASFLAQSLRKQVAVEDQSLLERVLLRTRQHLVLVAVSLTLAILAAIPLGVAAARRPRLGYFLLASIGIVQTIPALALLVLLLVLMRQTGAFPAILALFLYSLLPIVRNTVAGLTDIALPLRESAEALGLSAWPRLYLIELPLASRSILAGIKTAAVVNVGYATLGGLIGAGGYGQPIMDGVTRLNYRLILEGAVPAVVMALLVQALFEGIERLVVPKGLRLPMST